jgi:hypothetical protein
VGSIAPSDRRAASNICHMDQTMAIILAAFIVLVPVLSTFLGAESRPDFLRVDRRSRFRMVGSMRSEDWPPSEFGN